MSARIFLLAPLVIAVTGCEQQPVTVSRPQYMTAAERVPYVKDFEPSCLLKLWGRVLCPGTSQKRSAGNTVRALRSGPRKP
jgi:hypothetical protein